MNDFHADEAREYEQLWEKAEAKVEKLEDEIDRLTAEVERLKEFDLEIIQEGGHFTILVDGKEREYRRGHHITDEQIDAAVEIANSGTNIEDRAVKWRLLNKLNIHRCEGCDTEEKRRNYIRTTSTCPDCNGRGWVKK